MGKKIIWSENALVQLEDIHFYILFESKSLRIADKVTATLFESTAVLKATPENYELDNQKQDNDGSFRNYFVYNYKISYRIFNNQIQILRVKHTSRQPKNW